MKIRNEEGFNLVELIVVMLMLGVLAAITVPVFLNQRAKSNDRTVQTDMKVVVTQIKSMLVDIPNAVTVGNGANYTDRSYQDNTLDVFVEDFGGATDVRSVTLTDGVYIDVAGNSAQYTISGYHTQGSQYQSSSTAKIYRSTEGDFLN